MLLRSPVLALGVLLMAGFADAAPRQAVGSPSAVGAAMLPSPGVLQRLSQPMTRAEAVDIALGDPAMQRLMKAVLPQMKDLRTLRARTVAGMPVAMEPNLPDRAPVPGSLDELDWAGGVHISPISGGPVYAGPERNYRCATMDVHQITHREEYGLQDMVRNEVTCHFRCDPSALLRVNLPNHSGLYLLSFSLEDSDGPGEDIGGIYISASLTDTLAGSVALEWTRSPDSGAVVALLELPPRHTPRDPNPDPPLEEVTVTVFIRWPSARGASYFGGVTVTKL